jgi:ATP-dependent RNA helicase DeaD
VAPTRELAMQVHRELTWLYEPAQARVLACVGGMDVRREQRALAAGCHIVVGTPGRLRDHLERGQLDVSELRALVLDEADEMLDLGFREDLEFMLDATPPARRTLLFSATIAREIATLAKRYQRNALRIDTTVRNEPHGDIDYRALAVAPNDIEHAVVNVLRFYDAPGALVFCSTREAVKRLHARLVERGFEAVALSGEMGQSERTSALQALRDGRARVCVATDVAARGLDLPELNLVVHADLPVNRAGLLHRSGRTGRAGRALARRHPQARPGAAAARPDPRRRSGRGRARAGPGAAGRPRAGGDRRGPDPALPLAPARARGSVRSRPAKARRRLAARARPAPRSSRPRRRGLVPPQRRAQQERRPEVAGPPDLPPGPRHQGRDRRDPHLREGDQVRDRQAGRRALRRRRGPDRRGRHPDPARRRAAQ